MKPNGSGPDETTKSGNVAEPILDVLGAQPRKLAIQEAGRASIDYAGLRSHIVGLSAYLRMRGMLPGERVVLQVPNGIAFAASAVAVLLCGGVPVLCEPGLGDAIYLSRIRAAAPKWLLVHPIVVAVNRAPGARRWLSRREIDVPPVPSAIEGMETVMVSRKTLDRWGRTHASGGNPVCARRDPGDDAVIVFTGGTTQAPKGVRLSHQALQHYLTNIRSVIDDVPVDRFLADTPQQVLYALRLGRSAFTTRGRRERRARHVLRLIQRGDIDAYFGSPYIWVEMMAQSGSSRSRLPASLRTVLLGSAPVTPTFLRSLMDWLHPDTRVRVLYGLTEVGPVCAVRGEDKASWTGQGDLVGVPLPGIELGIEARDGDADVGEVVVRAPSLFSGYLGQPPVDPAHGLHTGDLGRLVRAEGQHALVLMGREKDMIIRHGVNLYPGALEGPIRALAGPNGAPLLRECALVGLWNAALQDEEVCLCVQPARPRDSLNPADLRSRVAAAVGPDGVPDHIWVVDPIPVTGRQNKVDKEALRARAAERFGLHARRGERDDEPAASRPRPPWDWMPGAALPFDWPAFLRKYALLARKEGQPAAVAGQLAFRLALLAIAQSSWALDEVLTPGWREENLRGPLFIVGHQRSGTTLLHRILAQDRVHARALSLNEMLLPAVSAQRGISGLARFDAHAGQRLRSRFNALQDKLFGPLDDIHRLRFDEIEEDEFVLWGIFASVMCANDAPSAAAMPELDDLRSFESWPVARQVRALGYYRACALKKLHREPVADGERPPWLVSKNPAFTTKMKELAQVFPDARFVYLVRDPLVTIPSRLSLIRAIWRRRFPSFRDMSSEHVEVILRDSVRTYLAAERDLPALPGDRTFTVRYEQLTARPAEAVAQIYDHFALPAPDATLLEAIAARNRRPRWSQHLYALEDFGLSKDRIRSLLAPVFDRYRFDERP